MQSSNMNAKIIISLVLAVVITGAIYGGYQYPKQTALVSSAAGTTFSTAKIAAINVTPTTQSATSTSILNSDASGRWITGGFANCTGDTTSYTNLTGAGLLSLTLKAATTSASGLGLSGNTNLAVNLTVATSTLFAENASSTPSSATVPLYWWPTNVYLTFLFNATTTATGACTIGATYIAS